MLHCWRVQKPLPLVMLTYCWPICPIKCLPIFKGKKKKENLIDHSRWQYMDDENNRSTYAHGAISAKWVPQKVWSTSTMKSNKACTWVHTDIHKNTAPKIYFVARTNFALDNPKICKHDNDMSCTNHNIAQLNIWNTFWYYSTLLRTFYWIYFFLG